MEDRVKIRVKELYDRSKRTQERNKVIWDMSFEEYYSLFSKYRLEKIAKVDSYGQGAWLKYIHDEETKPVCSWTSRHARDEGRMHIGNAKIMMAREALHMFKIKAGEKHKPSTILKMQKPKSEATKAKMALAQQKRRQGEKQDRV